MYLNEFVMTSLIARASIMHMEIVLSKIHFENLGNICGPLYSQQIRVKSTKFYKNHTWDVVSSIYGTVDWDLPSFIGDNIIWQNAILTTSLEAHGFFSVPFIYCYFRLIKAFWFKPFFYSSIVILG